MTALIGGNAAGVVLHAPAGSGRLDVDYISFVTAAAIFALGWWYFRGWQALPLRSRTSRPWRPLAFVAGLLAAAAVLLPPFDAVADQSFAAHMTQHLVLLFVVAPLCALSEPVPPLLRALTGRRRRSAARVLRLGLELERGLENPLLALAVFTVALWVWHIPAMFNLAERQPAVHLLEHGAFLFAGAAFVLPLRRVQPGLWFLPHLFATAMQGTILGALLTFSSEPWYAGSGGFAGLSPIADQQVGGALMSVAGGAATLAFGGWAFLRWAAAQPAAAPRRPIPPGEELAR